MSEPLILTCDYQATLSCRLCNTQRARSLFATKIVGGPPAVMKLSKYSHGELRLLLAGDRYVSVFSLETLLSNPPLREALIPADVQLQTDGGRHMFHQRLDRTRTGSMLTGDFGETSDIIITGCEGTGLSVRDLRVAKEAPSNLLSEPRIPEQRWTLPRGMGRPSKELRSVASSPDHATLYVLTQRTLVALDRRNLVTPKYQMELPICRQDSATLFNLHRRKFGSGFHCGRDVYRSQKYCPDG